MIEYSIDDTESDESLLVDDSNYTTSSRSKRVYEEARRIIEARMERKRFRKSPRNSGDLDWYDYE